MIDKNPVTATFAHTCVAHRRSPAKKLKCLARELSSFQLPHNGTATWDLYPITGGICHFFLQIIVQHEDATEQRITTINNNTRLIREATNLYD